MDSEQSLRILREGYLWARGCAAAPPPVPCGSPDVAPPSSVGRTACGASPHRQDVLGIDLPRWSMVVLDVYGTLHDPAHWEAPGEFRPDRFLGREVDPDLLVPQGGGDVAAGHRCPGEDVVLTMLAVAVRALATTPVHLLPQDLGHDLTELPTRPRSGVLVTTGGAGR